MSTSMSSRTLSVIVCTAVLAWPTVALAGTDTETGDIRTLSTIPLEELMQMRVVTAASKFAQPISDAPSSVVVLTASDIRDHGWRTLADALATLPGLYVTSDRNYTYLGARGFLRPGDYNSRFLLLVDGMRVNDAVYDQALIGTGGLIDMDMVKRIEFVPGPGSAVYGSNALFGVINVVTRDGSGLSGVQGAVTAAGQGERKARTSYGWHGQNGADLLLSASAFNRAGRDLYYPEFDTPATNNGIARHLDWDRAQNFLVKGSFGGVTLSASHVARTKGIPTGSFGAVFNATNQTRDTQTIIGAAWNRQLAPALALAVQLQSGQADYEGPGWYPDVEGVVRQNVDGAHARWYEASAHATLTNLPGQKIVIGAELGRDAHRDQYNYNEQPYELLLQDHRDAMRRAVFVEDEIRLPAGFLVNAGVRYDDREDPDMHRFSPRVAVVYKATPSDTVKLIAGSAFRAANAYEMYYALPEMAGGMLPNPNLRPEKIATRELVLEHVLAGGGHATLSLFRYAVDDLISQQLDPATDMLIFRNIDHADARGLEAALDRDFGAVRLRASYSWQLARGTGGVPLVDSPRHLAKANLTAPLGWRGGRVGAELQCSGRRLADQGAAGGYCVANVTLSALRLLPRTELSLSAYNATGKRYADVAGPAFVQTALAREGRTLAAKLDWRF
ncbi:MULTISPECIES: TonB-dependent receptor [unclassified Massilia]|uniref:TonB-dependent receptor plug domain-containing protein n=1 Tax=unclassified Massilia TaxID=2609279 RepID=UPI001E568F3C|nr:MULTISPECIES: TonB-dependent receptor [unclassified Massilia]